MRIMCGNEEYNISNIEPVNTVDVSLSTLEFFYKQMLYVLVIFALKRKLCILAMSKININQIQKNMKLFLGELL